MALQLQVHICGDGRCVPANCESNRRLLAQHFAAEGETEMDAVMCGFLIEFLGLKPGIDVYNDVDTVAEKLFNTYGKTPCSCRAAAMRIRDEQPELFERLAGKEPEPLEQMADEESEPFASHQWPVENV